MTGGDEDVYEVHRYSRLMGVDWGLGRYEETAAALEPVAGIVVDHADVKPGERALDLGCGTGNAAMALARAGAIVTAVDPAARLLEVTRSRAAASRALR